MWPPYSSGQTWVVLQKLLRNDPGHMEHADTDMVLDALSPFLQSGTSGLGSSPCTAHSRLVASKGGA